MLSKIAHLKVFANGNLGQSSCIHYDHTALLYYRDAMHQKQSSIPKGSLMGGLQTPAESDDIKKRRANSRITRVGVDATSAEMSNPTLSLESLLSDPNEEPEPSLRLSASDAAKQTDIPTNVRMLTRDFIDTSLYHPNYGYFSKKAYIFSPPEIIPFNKIKDNYSFMNYMAKMYKDIEEDYIHDPNVARQVWHTPTELFRPFYGYAVAKHMVSEYKRDSRGAKNMIIYEIGAGNGTLMSNIMDYISINEPGIYKTVEYNIIEISTHLAGKQTKSKLLRHRAIKTTRAHKGVRIINKSVLEWDEVVLDPCFFVAMEVIDNLSHDLIRYDSITNTPLQGIVFSSSDSDYQQAYEPLTDPLIKEYLDVRSSTGYKTPTLGMLSTLLAPVRRLLPFSANMSSPEFVPTSTFQLLHTLKRYFPQHRLVISDFDSLPDAIPGIDAPVVQTRYQGNMVACSTYLVQPGWFDIFFPTNFQLLKSVYTKVTGRDARVVTQKQFLEENADLEKTRTQSGENPMLSFYENFKFILS
ncbi:hypothetical protein BASA50_008429 [Batrachochytrium salamandrivorans]|uniref:Protein arginine methyltransferase NDUFAF7 n=1 Tax=Batrachochytrium salamandrivorans TaxID=1357716 RepID=A0ABQ8F4S5_9FUNG|nr:hypothetical protein BASA62_003657 [Batrachochytrium salamandrivorans]KAH6591915.1 hypothetical protein BASA50_008429 [Batrachochytrium salamandrivorans]